MCLGNIKLSDHSKLASPPLGRETMVLLHTQSTAVYVSTGIKPFHSPINGTHNPVFQKCVAHAQRQSGWEGKFDKAHATYQVW